MDAFFTSSSLLAIVTLTFLEIVLGVDNIIFISILSSKLPASRQGRARWMGLLAAMGTRILLLLSLVWIIRLTAPLFYVLGHPISARDLILIGGGLMKILTGRSRQSLVPSGPICL
jgi:predicted tellurium resistance membrane protein TerC